MNQITVGVITVSDRASQGSYDDLSGPVLKEAATKYGWEVFAEFTPLPTEIWLGSCWVWVAGFTTRGERGKGR